MISEPDQEEVRLAMEHLDIGFMRRFTRFAFNPTNPFIAGASVLGTVVAAQVYARMLVLVKACILTRHTHTPPPSTHNTHTNTHGHTHSP
jgi:hypothetical protein